MTDDDDDVDAAVLRRLAAGPATLADLRAALPTADPERRAAPSMGEPDAFGERIARLVATGRVLDDQGRYRVPEAEEPRS